MPFESFSYTFPITIVWKQHSTPFGIFSVCVCLFAGVFYQQAPKRSIDNTTTISGTTFDTFANTIQNTVMNTIPNTISIIRSGANRRNEVIDEESVSLTSTNETFEK